MFDASDKTAKKKIEVEVEFDDGKCLTGSLYIHPQGRLMDMLNDERMFFPFEKSDGTLHCAQEIVVPVGDGARQRVRSKMRRGHEIPGDCHLVLGNIPKVVR